MIDGLDEVALARLEAALRAQRENYRLPSMRPPSAGPASSPSEETCHDVDKLFLQPSSLPRSPPILPPVNAFCERPCVELSDELAITSLQIGDPQSNHKNSVSQESPVFLPTLIAGIVGAVLVASAFFIIGNSVTPVSVPMLNPTSASRSPSVNLEAVILASEPEEKSTVGQANQVSSNVLSISESSPADSLMDAVRRGIAADASPDPSTE